MGIVRLAKSLRLLKSIDEYNNRNDDIQNKISGNRVYMDFISIVYKIQEQVANELNYLLFCFILMNNKILNDTEITSPKFLHFLKKYDRSIKEYDSLRNMLINSTSKINNNDYFDNLANIVNKTFIDSYIKHVRSENILNKYVYENVVYFIVDLLTQKISDVEYVLIAFDGIPSFGKVQEQRQRRYMRYAFLEFKKIISRPQVTQSGRSQENLSNLQIDISLSKSKLILAREIYDKEHFQVDIRSAIEYVYNMYHNTNLQENIIDGIAQFRNSEVIENRIKVEVIDRPFGEGEKILMDKLIEDYNNYGNDKTYAFYSPDGDSVILCLCVYIKTKMKYLNVIKMYVLEPSDTHNNQSQYVDIVRLYNNIVKVVEKYSHIKLETFADQDAVNCDFIFIMNLYGNDFLHQIPTMDISTTIMDTLYVYSKFIRDNNYIINNNDNSHNNYNIHHIYKINFNSLRLFFKEIADFEQFIMLDTYLLEINERNRIIKYFGDIFPCRYAIDYRDTITEIKKDLHKKITNNGTNANTNNNTNNIEIIKQIISDIIYQLNQTLTVTGKKYGEIFFKIEVKNINIYAGNILSDPNYLLTNNPRFLYNFRPKMNKNEKEIKRMVDLIEYDLIKNNQSIDLDKISNSNDKRIKDFLFDYKNIRLMIPHDQMPTTDKDIDLYLLEWKSGKWMDILNAYPYELGYDWKHNKIRKIDQEIKRYQYNMLELNNTNMNKMIINYLKTMSWMNDYYMNTNHEVETLISTWSYNYERSPFITQIYRYIENITDNDLKNIMKDIYKKSLIDTNHYLQSEKHKFYIYPHSSYFLQNILPKKYQLNFPDMNEYVIASLKMANESNNNNNNKNKKNEKNERVFDCRMCPYFSKCLFKNKTLTFKELNALEIPSEIYQK